MSLINKVLLDLDRRAQDRSSGRALFADVRPVGAQQRQGLTKTRRYTLLLGACAIVICIIIVATTLKEKISWTSLSGPTILIGDPLSTRAGTVTDTPDRLEAHPAQPALAMTVPPPGPSEPEPAPDKAFATNTGAAVLTKPTARTPSQAHPTPITATAEPHVTTGMQLERNLRPLNASEKAENQYRKAVSLLRGNRLDQAEQALRTALFVDPSHVAARETLADLALQTGRVQQAQQELYEAMAMLPQHPGFVTRLARIYVDEGEEARALGVLEDNLSRARPDDDYHGLLATLYQRAKRHAEARDHFRNALSFKPEEGRWWLGLGISAENLGEWPLANEAYTQASRHSTKEAALREYAEQRRAAVMTRLP